MEVPGLGSVNNPLRLDPGRVKTPEVLPGKVTTEQSPQQAPIQQSITLPYQAPKTPVLTQNQQTFSSLLIEMGIPNNLPNNQLAQVLANYGQPINKQTMSQVTQAMGYLIQTGPVNIEAAVVLMINGMSINNQSIDGVKQLLSSGGLSQNLLGFSKDLQKMIENFTNKNISEQFSQSKELISQAIVNKVNNPATQQLAGQVAVISSQEGIENAKPDSTAIKLKEGKVEAINPAMKNPYGEEEHPPDPLQKGNQGEESGNEKRTNKAMPEQRGMVRSEIGEIKLNFNDPQVLVNELSTKAQKINKNIINLLTIDILKNPSQFPQQIAMLRKYFSELEIDIKEFKEIILKKFPGILEEDSEEENIFTDLLKLVFSKEEPEKLKNLKDSKNLKNPASFESNLFKDIAKAAEAINLNMLGRELMTKAIDCMCLPLSIIIDGKLYQTEIMIKREDQSNKKTEIGHVPIKIQLAVETKTMGKVAIDISNLKRDLQVCLSVENKYIQNRVKVALDKLQGSLKSLPFDLSPIQCIVNPRPDENTSILLPHKYKVLSMRRIEGIV